VPVAQDENVRGYNDILAQLHVWGDCIS
jgi:hypothetical protein